MTYCFLVSQLRSTSHSSLSRALAMLCTRAKWSCISVWLHLCSNFKSVIPDHVCSAMLQFRELVPEGAGLIQHWLMPEYCVERLPAG